MWLFLEHLDSLGTTKSSPYSTETFRINSPPGPTASFFGCDEPSLREHPRVVRDRRLTAIERHLEVATAHFLSTGDDREQSKSGGVGDGRQDCREFGGVWFRKWCRSKRCAANLFCTYRQCLALKRPHYSTSH